jgi:peptide/nickel transport system permease protein
VRGLDFVARRLAFGAFTVVGSILLSFLLFRLAPGDPTSRFARVPETGPEIQAALRREFRLDDPLLVQLWAYLKQLAGGNLGISYANRQPVLDNLVEAIGNTLPMVLAGTVLAVVLGVVTGVLAASRHGGPADYGALGAGLLLFSLPTQWIGLLALIAFAGVLPLGGREDPFLFDPTWWEHVQDVAYHMILPATVLGLTLFGGFTLIMRSSMLSVLGEDFILTARAKGLSRRSIVWRHAARNALLPTVSQIALTLGFVVSGALLIETVFSWPGIGRATYDAVKQSDYPMLQGIFLVITLSVVLCNVLADLLYFRLDPRIKS